MSKGLSRLLLLMLVAGRLQLAYAERPSDEKQARMHYTAGKTLYNLGNYPDALRELLLGYDLVAKPQFLLNIGQCYRRLGELGKAREMYQKYLRDTPPTDRDRPKVEELVHELDAQIAAQTPPPPPLPSPEPVVVVPPPAPPPPPVVVAAPSPAPVSIAVTAAPPKKVKRRAWWAIPVAVVGAAGLSVGLYFALRPSCTASYGCISAGGQ